MRQIIIMLGAAFLLGACQTPCPAPQAEPRTARFACADGSTLTVTFTRVPDEARVEEEGYTALVLPARIVGSGYRYTAGEAELRGRAEEITWTRPGALETVCRQTP